MTAPAKEQFKNAASTTLNGGINNSVTSITATDGSVFPSVGNFRIIVDSELMICTARSSNTLTVTRGAEGTSAASHSDLAPLTHIVTAGALAATGKDSVPLAGEFPALNKLVAANGTTLLTSSDFSWTNQGTASITDFAGTMALRVPSTSNTQFRILTVAAPSAPWSLIAALKIFAPGEVTNSNPGFGLVLRESSTGKFYSFTMNRQSGATQRFAIDKWTNATTWAGSTPFLGTNPIFLADVLWMKLEDDNTNVKFYLSNDGIEWVQVFSESRTTFLAGGPNQIGFTGSHGDDTNAKDAVIRLLHWHTE